MTKLNCILTLMIFILVSVATQTEAPNIELEIRSDELIVCCSKSVTECTESTVCGESYLHVADIQFGESGAFDNEYHIETFQNECSFDFFYGDMSLN